MAGCQASEVQLEAAAVTAALAVITYSDLNMELLVSGAAMPVSGID